MKAADHPAHELKPGSNSIETPATAAAAGMKEVVAAEAIPGPPGEMAKGKVESDRHRRRFLSVCYPRVCALQASSQAGGTFENVVRFSVEPPPPTVSQPTRRGTWKTANGAVEG